MVKRPAGHSLGSPDACGINDRWAKGMFEEQTSRQCRRPAFVIGGGKRRPEGLERQS